jgi:hypothetical protein
VNINGVTASPAVAFVSTSNIPVTSVSITNSTSAVGFSFDSASHNNVGLETDTCVAGVTTCISDSGGNNKVTTGGVVITSSSGNELLCSGVLPTISAGFNTGTIGSSANGTCSFFVTVGSGGAGSTGTLTLPTASAGWNCSAQNQSRADVIQQTSNSPTSAVLTNFGVGFSATNFTNGDNILVSCFAR